MSTESSAENSIDTAAAMGIGYSAAFGGTTNKNDSEEEVFRPLCVDDAAPESSGNEKVDKPVDLATNAVAGVNGDVIRLNSDVTYVIADVQPRFGLSNSNDSSGTNLATVGSDSSTGSEAALSMEEKEEARDSLTDDVFTQQPTQKSRRNPLLRFLTHLI